MSGFVTTAAIALKAISFGVVQQVLPSANARIPAHHSRTRARNTFAHVLSRGAVHHGAEPGLELLGARPGVTTR